MNLGRCCAVWLAILAAVAGTELTGMGQEGCTVVVEPGESVQAAIDSTPEGAVICLASGEWEESLVIEKDLTLVGAGPDVTVIRGGSVREPVITIRETEGKAVRVHLEGLGISGGVVGIAVVGTVRAAIENCTVSENNYDGIVLQGNSQATIQGCTVIGNKERGIMLQDNAQATIRNNVIRENARYGIFSYSTGAVEGSGNRMEGNGCDLYGNLPSGLKLVEETEEEIVYPDPRFSTLQEAVDALLPGGRLILKAGEYQGGVSIDKPLTLMAEEGAEVVVVAKSEDVPVFSLIGGAVVELRGLTISEGLVGVVLGGTAQATIQGCTVSKNSWYGIKLQDNSQATIQSCTVSESKGHGIALWDSAQATIQDCTVSGSVFGIDLYDSAQATIQGCTVSENKGHGIALHDSAQATIQGCTVSGSVSGIDLYDSAQATIQGCTVSDNIWGIGLHDSAQATIENNIVENNYEAGVSLYESPCFNTEEIFTGYVAGKGNTIRDNWPYACPQELGFLATEEGGTLDRRR